MMGLVGCVVGSCWISGSSLLAEGTFEHECGVTGNGLEEIARRWCFRVTTAVMALTGNGIMDG